MTLKSLMDKCRTFFDDESGASGIEYAIVATLVAVVLVGFSGPISEAITGVFSDICTALGATGCPTP